MNRRVWIGAVLLLVSCVVVNAQQTSQVPSEWKRVEDALGRKGSMQPGDVFKFGMPRSDLRVTVEGTPIKPGLALGSWAAFKTSGKEAIVMGDLVLLGSEVEPVMMKLQEMGIEETAVHNHLLGESPRVMYMHIAGHGDAVKLASALKSALALTKTPPAYPASSAKQPNLGIDTAQIDQILGHNGKNNGGIYQVSVPRAETITDMGMEIPPSMGTATSINFQPTGNGRAAITGDFVLLGSEVNPVIRALRDHGIQVTALHSHMLTENPRLFFMHYWANDNAVSLAKGLRAALDKTNSAHISK
ncbi:MAG TPA: DUF1259 domain-containing protein [Terriglobales bacterium]|nr:DUF1259 domain-containing protein [Terriglobales bacterium]